MALPPAPPVPDVPIGAIGPVPVAPTPEALATMPTPPDLGLAAVPELLPAPPTPAVEPPPKPAPVPEVPAHMRRAQEVESAQATVEAGLGRIAELRAEDQALAEKFVAAQTPEERAKLQEQAAGLRDATAVAERLVGQAQQGVEERVATAAAARNVEMAEAQEASLREQQAEAAKVRQEADVRAKAREEALATAREQMATDRQAARALLERGPQATGVALTLSSMFTEAVRAAKAREVPNFQAIFQQAWERDRQAFADEFDRAQGAMQITGDEIADLAQREREDAARQATAIAAIAEQAEQRMELQVAQATTEEQRILASQVLPMLRQERARREQDAIAAREQAELKRRESEASIAHKQAQTRKLGAEATIAERKAARVGVGGARVKQPIEVIDLPPELRKMALDNPKAAEQLRTVAKRSLRDPVTGRLLLNKDGTPWQAGRPEQVEKLQKTAADMATLNEITNGLIAMRNKHGWERTAEMWATGEGQEMQALSTMLAMIQKDTWELGVLAGPDMDLLNQLTGGDPTGFKDPTPALERTRQELNRKFDTQLRTIGGPATIRWKITKPGAAKQRPADIRTLVTRGFDPRTQTAIPATERADAAAALPDVLAQEIGDVGLSRADRLREGHRLATEQVENQLLPQIREEQGAIRGEIMKAMAAGDDASVDRLRDSLKQSQRTEERLRVLQGKWSGRLAESRALEVEAKERARAEVEEAERRFEAGEAPAGARPGGF